MDVPGRRSILAALLNHGSPGVSPGTWEPRGMSPTGYPGYPTPLRVRIDMRPAEAVERPHWDVSDNPIALDQKNFRKRARSSRLPFNLIFPVAYALNGPISLRISARSVPASVTIVMSAWSTPPSRSVATFASFT